ncbi:hypothetical protein [Pseudomonas sp. R37(2017)]|uniref:hypothetical protein n=1 Tax=Pseudomonas sp. R37(2017) TaxID=1981685 RepID=UPI00117BCAEC|nr:hypothetical protein [Pseudomonas sp. R37(2017)]
MQRIDLANVCPTHGGTHLLSKSQAQKWLAEVAESMPKTDARGATGQAPANPLPEGANPEESQPYHWENPVLFQDTGLEILTSKVLGLYQDDYLFLVLRDDFGVMRDLANAQLKVSDWIEHWSADDQRQVQYLTGTYIQSLYEVNATRLQAESTTDPAVKALMDDTTGQQQSKIYEYLKLRRDQPDPGVYGNEAHWRKAAQINPLAQAIVDMKEAMGQALYQRHQGTIGKLSAQTWEALFGEAFGQRGIDHLVDRASMEAFVSQQQTLLSHWHKRLSHIREDRLGMIIGGHFHRAAWYYDFHLDKQIQHRLETEFVCVAALCPDRSSAEKLAAYRNANLLVVVPGLETLDLTAQMDVAKKLADLSSFTINVLEIQKSYAEINLLTNQFRSLMNERLPNYALLNTQFKGMQSLLEGAYVPANQLEAADQLDKAYKAFTQAQHIDPNDYIRNIGPAARLQVLREFSRQGLTLRGASATEIAEFNQARTQSMNLRSQLKETYKLRNRELSLQSTGFALPGSEAVYNQHIEQLKSALIPWEERLSGALTVGSDSPARIGTVIDGLDPQLRAEMGRTARDFRATGTFNKPLTGVLQSKADGIAFALFVIQGQKFVEALTSVLTKDNRSLNEGLAFIESFIGMSAAGFATVQGLSITILQPHIEQMRSASGKLNTMSRLGYWTGVAGLGAFAFAGIAALFDLVKHTHQWGKAFAEGDYKKLSATTMQMTGDGVVLGTSVWATKHIGAIVRNIVKLPTELRALAWAEASPRLLSIGARANLIGLIGTALQLMGQGLYNYFNLDDLQKWMMTSAWGNATTQRALQEEWSELARVVQKPTCELIRDDRQTYLRLTLPGVSTQEMDRRQLQLQAWQRGRDNSIYRPYSAQLPPVRWMECSAIWATRFMVASEGPQALTLHWPIGDLLQTTDFALAFTIAYQLEAEREPLHQTCFVLRDLRISYIRGVRVMTKGTFTLESVEAMPAGTGKAPFFLFTREDLAAIDV